ncbi:ATP-binding protein [Mycoplasma capricolum]|uniref:IstB-like ATP-binding domain-containing protein n=1 Tax=Mycoplasma capricolum subsp. capricolum (strain California kid / ATCC 27343 / NCTC 10154) TaxID=340047 RepID=Q2SSV6_MYCCT|nr:ATP-binding protein [Mycoplasma capricolum]ABC01851.1 hypothetical protein MCAP_0167 [Mycoplasma capricolum subsp. capricolum ATCC 27343]
MIKKLNVNNNEQEILFNNLKSNSTSCYIFGLPGVGKTYFVNNLVNQMKLEFNNNNNKDFWKKTESLDVEFINLAELVEKIKNSWNSKFTDSKEVLQNQIRRLINCKVLVIDDLGVETLSQGVYPYIFELFDKRYDLFTKKELITIITSNYSPENLKKYYNKKLDVVNVERLISRVFGLFNYNFINFIGTDKRNKTLTQPINQTIKSNINIDNINNKNKTTNSYINYGVMKNDFFSNILKSLKNDKSPYKNEKMWILNLQNQQYKDGDFLVKGLIIPRSSMVETKTGTGYHISNPDNTKTVYVLHNWIYDKDSTKDFVLVAIPEKVNNNNFKTYLRTKGKGKCKFSDAKKTFLHLLDAAACWFKQFKEKLENMSSGFDWIFEKTNNLTNKFKQQLFNNSSNFVLNTVGYNQNIEVKPQVEPDKKVIKYEYLSKEIENVSNTSEKIINDKTLTQIKDIKKSISDDDNLIIKTYHKNDIVDLNDEILLKAIQQFFEIPSNSLETTKILVEDTLDLLELEVKIKDIAEFLPSSVKLID